MVYIGVILTANIISPTQMQRQPEHEKITKRAMPSTTVLQILYYKGWEGTKGS